jgi:Ribosomal protein L11 methyltransferase (PrmA)
MSLVLEEHRDYIADKLRISLYRRAINQVVKPGDVVMDLGAGSGILGMLACQAGAKRVYAVDAGGMIQVARELARANGFGDRIVGVKGMSTRIDLPEKVDVIIADQIGYFGFEAGLFEYFRDACRRFLKRGGRTIPLRVDLQAGAMNSPRSWKSVEFWSAGREGLDLSSARAIASNTCYPRLARDLKLLSSVGKLCSLDVASAPRTFSAETIVRIARDGVIHGIAGWFSAQLSPHVTMTNNPVAQRKINRPSSFMPLDRPVRVVKNDWVKVGLNATPEQSLMTWKIGVSGKTGEKAHFTQSTMRSLLLTPDALSNTDPNFKPQRSPWGDARREVLELCDGTRSLGEIERLILEHHRVLFEAPEQASQLVAEVIAANVK